MCELLTKRSQKVGPPLSALLSFVCLGCVATGDAYGQFTTVLNIPPDSAIGIVESNTQVNLYAGGTLGEGLSAGHADVTNTNIEVNVFDGSVGPSFNANNGSTVNVSGGSFGTSLSANNGSRVNIAGGTIEGPIDFRSGSIVHINGGTFGNAFRAHSGSALAISGSDFHLNGLQIEGLDAIGDELPFDIPEESVLTGILADGTPFAFASVDFDRIEKGVLTLKAASLPPVGPSVIMAPTDPVPQGIRVDQTLVVMNGGQVNKHFSAGRGSTVHVVGGQVGENLEAIGATVTISDGLIGGLLNAFDGSLVNISGGVIGFDSSASLHSIVNISGGSVGGDFNAESGSVVNVSGGQVGGFFRANQGATVNITGGEVGPSFQANSGSAVNISGGAIGAGFRAYGGSNISISAGDVAGIFAEHGSVVTITGGTIDHFFFARESSEVNLIGRQFVLDGIDISGTLTPNVPHTISARDVPLSGVLADGSPFRFILDTSRPLPGDVYSFHPSAKLTVTLVPEANSLNLILLAAAVLMNLMIVKRRRCL